MKCDFLGPVIILFSVLAAVLGENAVFNPPRPWIKTGPAVAIDTCRENYYPCTCNFMSYPDESMSYITVQCNDVPSFEAVKSVFQRTTTQVIRSFTLTVPLSEGNNPIPADFLSGKSAQWIELRCPTIETQLNIDPMAFHSSQNYTEFIHFSGCDHSQLDYTFLSNFSNLSELCLATCRQVSQWSNLPALPSLLTLTITASPDFDGFQNLPVPMLPALNRLAIIYCPNFQFLKIVPTVTMLLIDSCPLFKQWDVVVQLESLNYLNLIGLKNQTIHEALNSLVSSHLVSRLLSLSLYLTDLTQVPPQIQSFSNLQEFSMSHNPISTARNGSFAFTSPKLRLLYFVSNGLGTIEPEAFQGNFSLCDVHLESNNLKRFESSVFKSMLEQMKTANSKGIAYVSNNPFECDCHLAWLFRDNYHLLDRVDGGTCSNGTSFSSLTPQNFDYCSTDGGASNSVQLFNSIYLMISLAFLSLNWTYL